MRTEKRSQVLTTEDIVAQRQVNSPEGHPEDVVGSNGFLTEFKSCVPIA